MADSAVVDRFDSNTPVSLPSWGDQNAVPRSMLDTGDTVPSGVSFEQVLHDVRTGGPPPTSIVVSMLAELCEALTLVHNQGTAHGGLCPERLLLGPGGHVHVVDFDEDTLPAEQQSYAAPEVLDGAAASTRGDVFSIGVIAYELLTGRPLFGNHMDIDLRNCIGLSITPPSDHNLHCPDLLDALILRALAPEPEARWASVSEMGIALSKIVSPAAADVKHWLTKNDDALDSVPSLALRPHTPRLPMPPLRAARGSVRLARDHSALPLPAPATPPEQTTSNIHSPDTGPTVRPPTPAPWTAASDAPAMPQQPQQQWPSEPLPADISIRPQSRYLGLVLAFAAGAIAVFVFMSLLS